MTSRDIKNIYHVPSSGHLAKHDLRFIINLKLTHSLMRHLEGDGRPEDRLFLELGPGGGSLTRSLLTRPCRGVLGVELDHRFNPHLDQIAQQTKGKFRWCNANVLDVDEYNLVAEHFPEFAALHTRSKEEDSGAPLRNSERASLAEELHRASLGAAGEDTGVSGDQLWWSGGQSHLEVVANLPFGVAMEMSSRLAVDCGRKEGIYRFGRTPVHLFFQKEVAERIVAVPQHPSYGRPTVLLQNFFRCRIRQTFTEFTYYPRTEVLGAMVTLEPRPVPLVDVNPSALSTFAQLVLEPKARNTGIHRVLLRAMPPEVAAYILQEAGIDGALLPYQLTVVEISRLALLWVRYLEASNQPMPDDRTFDHVETVFDREDAVANHDFGRKEHQETVARRENPPTW